MDDRQLKTPICFIIFKRSDTTKKVFEAIRQVKPSKLLVIADGPRKDVPGEAEKCAATRAIIDGVDWNCEVLKNYSEVNLGTRYRIPDGLNWVFENVEEAIVLEDDCLPHPTFFQFCEELLDRYRYNERVAVISGNNFLLGNKYSEDSYYFSTHGGIWGWATWRRAWQNNDINMKLWPEMRDRNFLEDILEDASAVKCWQKIFQLAYDGYTAWDYAWIFSCLLQKSLTINPNVNLVSNIGFNADATGNIGGMSPVFVNLYSKMPVAGIHSALQHPIDLVCDVEADNFSRKVVQDLYWQFVKIADIRKEIADFWIGISKNEFDRQYFRENIIKVLNSGIGDERMDRNEPEFIEEIKARISKEEDDREFIRYLSIAMLYCRPHELPSRWYERFDAPDWFLNVYLKFILETPNYFQEIGEADSYCEYIKGLIDHLHAKIFSNPNSEIWKNIAWAFTQKANLIPLYFNYANLKEIYIKRAEIIEFALKTSGAKIDWVFPDRPSDKQKIRLGILSSHFSPQTETFCTFTAFEYLDREQFEIILYAVNASDSPLEKYCQSRADRLVKLPDNLPDRVQKIRADELDILLIGTNVTAVTNLITLLAVHRLARIQTTSVCSCVTTGMRNIDYYISGKLTEPAINAQEQYREKLIALEGPAHCFNYYAIEPETPTIVPTRSSWGATDETIVFASGANFYKIIPELRETWAKILAGVPNSILLLYPFNPNWSNNYPSGMRWIDDLRSIFAKYSIDPSRLVIVKPLPSRADIKECLKLADIYLDSYPFSGVTSLFDPLEVGLPPIVMDGNSFRSLMAPALLRELEMFDLIADREESYIKLAINLAGNAELRQNYKDNILQKMQTNPRFVDSRSYSEQMGIAFQKLFREWEKIEAEKIAIAENKSAANELLEQPIDSPQFLNLLKGCANLYEIDPFDETVLVELHLIRKRLADFWLNAEADRLESLYSGNAGKAHQILIESGFEEECVSESDRIFVDELLTNLATGFEDKKAINYRLAAMLYRGGKIREEERDRLPHWLP